MQKPDLAGVYITDDHIDVVVGRDLKPTIPKLSLSQLTVEIPPKSGTSDPSVARFPFQKYATIAAAIDAVTKWISSRTVTLRSVGIASYGPFITISKDDRLSFMHRKPSGNTYGQLQVTSHGRLSAEPVGRLFRDCLDKYINTRPLITMDTDVSAAVIGEVYRRSFSENATRDKSIDDRVFVFVKVSLGVGAAFTGATTTWRGRLHPEAGQFHVPRWHKPGLAVSSEELAFALRSARNPDSVEALASVPAINARFKPLKFPKLLTQPEHVAWDREAWYLAHLIWTLTCVVSPHCIIMGGRVMGVPGLIEKTRKRLGEMIGDPIFPDYPELRDLSTYVVKPSDGDLETGEVGRPGVRGALCIAAMEPQYYDGRL